MLRFAAQVLRWSLPFVILAACGERVSEVETGTPPAAGTETRAAEPAPRTATAASTPASTPAATPAQDPLATIREFIASKSIDKSAAGWKTRLPIPPKLSFDADKRYTWLLQTSEGPITIRLMPDVAPMHVSSTIYLTELGFYDGISFHRVIPGFMAQGGDPLGTGSGGPGYKYSGETSPKVKHDKPGLLSMANAGPGTDGSQFFLTFVPTPHLDGRHTIFGEVVEGFDNLKKMERFGSAGGQTSKPLVIDAAKIVVE